MKKEIKRCAIYTRKSTEEGLDQEFNTLDAQREACLAFIASQKSEGWTPIPDRYDDGGYSGGNLQRPALQRLLDDIKAGLVSTVVVYKIDRLTRALMDFSKLVEVFDAHNVTFVSITQSFNTTTSMGRLTLNVLLSFAQFEREVIGERVRDKIAASKRKGMWMGGNNPLGYQRLNRELVPHEDHVAIVGMIFQRYRQLRSVDLLVRELRDKDIRSPVWISSKGVEHGGRVYSRGALNEILRNPVYIGKIRHKTRIYDGLHQPIIDQSLWDDVQAQLAANKAKTAAHRKQNTLLQGKLFDRTGTLYSPTYTIKDGRRYGYYLSRNLLAGRDQPHGLIARLPAGEVDDLIRQHARAQLSDVNLLSEMLALEVLVNHQLLDHVVQRQADLDVDALIRNACTKAEILDGEIAITFDCDCARAQIAEQLDLIIAASDGQASCKSLPLIISRSRKGAIMIDAPQSFDHNDPFNRPDHQIQNWVKGVVWRDMHFRGHTLKQIAEKENVGLSYVARLINQSFVAP